MSAAEKEEVVARFRREARQQKIRKAFWFSLSMITAMAFLIASIFVILFGVSTAMKGAYIFTGIAVVVLFVLFFVGKLAVDFTCEKSIG